MSRPKKYDTKEKAEAERKRLQKIYYQNNRERIYARNLAYKKEHIKDLRMRAKNGDKEAIEQLKKMTQYNTNYVFYTRSVANNYYLRKLKVIEERISRLQKKKEQAESKKNYWSVLTDKWNAKLENSILQRENFLQKIETIRAMFERK